MNSLTLIWGRGKDSTCLEQGPKAGFCACEHEPLCSLKMLHFFNFWENIQSQNSYESNQFQKKKIKHFQNNPKSNQFQNSHKK